MQNFGQQNPYMAQPGIAQPGIAQPGMAQPGTAQQFGQFDPGMGQQFAQFDMMNMGQQFAQFDPNMGQQFAQFDPNMAQQFGQFDPNMAQQFGQFDPNLGQQFAQFDLVFGQQPVDPAQQTGFASYGSQWAQYENQAAQYSPTNTVEGENAELFVDQAGEVKQPGEGAAPTEEESYDPFAVDENDPNNIAMPMYGYDQSFMPEFGANVEQQQYEYAPYTDSYGYQQVPYFDGNQPVIEQRWRAHPVLVFSLMLICFPIGLAMMLFFTDWGAFAKLYTTFFVLAMALAIYEILVNKQVVATPSIIQMLKNMLG